MNNSKYDGEIAHFQAIADHVASARGITSYTIDVEVGTIKGDNYMGKIYKLKISGNKVINLIVKEAVDSAAVREMMPIRRAFEREIFLYENVLKVYENFQKEKNITNIFNPAPKCFYTNLEEEKELLVLEDLNERGYRMCNRKETMDEDHISFVLQTYGKLHALSFALKDQNPELFAELTSNLQNIFENPDKKFDNKMYFDMQINNAVKLFDVNEEADVISSLETLRERCMEMLENLKTSEFNVVTHGDCWCNNMMFRYQDESRPSLPSDIRLVDFQLSSLGSVVMDLSYFIYSCSPKEVFCDLDKYLKIYYSSLSSFLVELGSSPENIISFEDLKAEWRKHCVFGFLVSIMLIRIMLFEADEVPDVEKLASEPNMLEAFSKVVTQSSDGKYKCRIRDLIDHFAENKFF